MTNTLGNLFTNISWIVPEMILIATVCAVILADVVLPFEKTKRSGWIALGGLIAATVAVLTVQGGYGANAVFEPLIQGASGYGPNTSVFAGLFVRDKLADFLKLIFLLGTIAVVLFSMRGREIEGYRCGEYYALMLSATLGAMFIASSNNFIMLVLALETLSLCSYVLAGYRKHDRLCAEASLKYILYGSVASGVMLFGISYIYGMTGTLDIRNALFALALGEDNGRAVAMAFILMLGGLGFKMAAVPFHFWAPDVYQGAPTPITAYLSTVSKAAGFAVALRILLPLFAVQGQIIPDDVLAVRGPLLSLIADGQIKMIFWLMAVGSMTLGNLIALRQTDFKRLMAYSSIAHAGYILMGLTVFSQVAIEAILFYLFVYFLTNLGTFLIIILMIQSKGNSAIESYRGLGYSNPLLAVALVTFLVSLTGLPPTAGFLGKLGIFYAVVGAGSEALTATGAMTPMAWFYYSLAIIGGLNTAISLYYYMKIAKLMYFEEPKERMEPIHVPFFEKATLMVFLVPVLALILQFDPIYRLTVLFERLP